MASVDEGVPDSASARVRIQLVVIGAKVGDLDLAYTIVEVVLPSSADMLLTNRRGSGSSYGLEIYERGCGWRLEIDESSYFADGA